MYVSCNMEARSCSHCCRGKVVSITYSECVSVACPGLLYFFPHYLINGTIFRKKKVVKHKKGLLIDSTTFGWSISHAMKHWAIMYVGLHVRVNTRYSCQTLMKPEFSIQILEKYQISWKSVPWERSCSSRTDRQTDGRTGGRTDRRTAWRS
jgi:hypothetical protein